ncbi:aryl-sulfate sulfotransferase [Natronomonas salina]|uniref:arylsulfotransferase family protein n=1 Tax=Natronomonas salina TaxID=1710540 RepID=UPI0015B5EF72|nr:arylsulfotransferase family protein [Natronomonas salina]QLD88073.1 aryl-sulfate sulfotransferase [Natronomonas salina]
MRWKIRAVVVAILVLSAVALAHGAATAPRTASADTVPEPEPRDNVTVVTESAKYGTLIAWNPDGSVLYYEDEHTKYYDVDPVANESMTVEYAATETIHTEGPTCSSPPCTRNIVERANLSTGEVEEVYARYDAEELAAEWHDHDRVDENHIVIADMIDDQVFLVDTETQIVEWLWDAQADFPVEEAGDFPDDWAHLNDVEVLEDGRVMVSLRNQDQVVFLDRETGLIENQTLGSENDYGTLHEQHNPDYIPEERGGPAVLVADSENGRIVEYQRDGDEWTQSWEWSDDRMQWPRDADRLPNGNTLVADTHGKRVAEIAPNGSVAWSVPVTHPYDAERLGTGGGSSSGQSATELDLESRTGDAENEEGGFNPISAFVGGVKSLFPSRLVNGVIYISPVWMGRPQFLAAGASLVSLLVLAGLELRWRFPDVEVRSPFYRDRE